MVHLITSPACANMLKQSPQNFPGNQHPVMMGWSSVCVKLEAILHLECEQIKFNIEIFWHQKQVKEISVKTGRRRDWAHAGWSERPLRKTNQNLARNAAHLTGTERWNFGPPFQSHHRALVLQSIALEWCLGKIMNNTAMVASHQTTWFQCMNLSGFILRLDENCMKIVTCLLLQRSILPSAAEFELLAKSPHIHLKRMQSQNDAIMGVGTAYLRFYPSTNILRNLHNPIK